MWHVSSINSMICRIISILGVPSVALYFQAECRGSFCSADRLIPFCEHTALNNRPEENMRYLRASKRSIWSHIKAGGDKLHSLWTDSSRGSAEIWESSPIYGHCSEGVGFSYLEIICQIRIFDSLVNVFLKEKVGLHIVAVVNLVNVEGGLVDVWWQCSVKTVDR